jgi:hypothetical protein
MDTIPTWVAIVTTIGAMFGGPVGVWLLSIYKEKKSTGLTETKQATELRISENEQAFKIYKDLLDTLKQNLAKLTEDMKKEEERYLKVLEENAILRTEQRIQKTLLEEQRLEIEYLKQQVGIKTLIRTDPTNL